MGKKISLLMLGAAMATALSASAQEVAIKTNLLYDAAASPSLGVEIGIAPKWTFDLSANVNKWKIDGKQWKHWEVTPEFRYWLCEKFQGNFIGVNVMGGQFSVGNIHHIPDFLGSHFSNLPGHLYKGWGVGAGIVYGHSWVLAKHWNLEAEIGVGWIYTRYDQKNYFTGKKLRDNAVHNYVGPTKAAINLEYVF